MSDDAMQYELPTFAQLRELFTSGVATDLQMSIYDNMLANHIALTARVAEVERESKAIRDVFHIERDDISDCYWVPAEPGPIQCETWMEAVTKWSELRDDDTARELREARTRLAASEQGREALSWALDILDMCDKRLVQLGDPPERVYSAIHIAGKAKARAALDAARGTEKGAA